MQLRFPFWHSEEKIKGKNKDKLVLPKLIWPDNKRYVWAAWDRDGWVVFYTNEPVLGDTDWICEVGDFLLLPYEKNELYKIPNIESVWVDTLHKRS